VNPDERELKEFLAGIYERLRQNEQALNQLQVTATALIQSLDRVEPRFRAAYAESFAAIKDGPIGQSLPVQLDLIDAVIQGLRNSV
jgi:hypothetical protein